MLRREDGAALVLVMGSCVVLAIVGTTLMEYSTHNSALASRSAADQTAFSIAEAGLNDAMSVLGEPSNNALTPGLLCSTGAPLPCDLAHARTAAYAGGTVKYWGVLDPQTSTWSIRSWGFKRNPTGPGTSDVVRRISASVKVRPSFMQPPN